MHNEVSRDSFLETFLLQFAWDSHKRIYSFRVTKIKWCYIIPK